MAQKLPNLAQKWPKIAKMAQKCPKMAQKWAQAEKNSIDISAASATFCISVKTSTPLFVFKKLLMLYISKRMRAVYYKQQ